MEVMAVEAVAAVAKVHAMVIDLKVHEVEAAAMAVAAKVFSSGVVIALDRDRVSLQARRYAATGAARPCQSH